MTKARGSWAASLLALFALLAFASPASAAKEAIAFIPSDAGSSAVNVSGAGPADLGDIYITSSSLGGGSRIQRYATDDNGTPANPYDDSFPFVAAWGADVDGIPSGGNAYEICTVEGDCKSGVAASGNGALNGPVGIAVDQDTGEVYVGDAGNDRINVYAGDGTFLRSVGWDVVAAGPGETGTGYEICIAADGDACKVGSNGAGTGQLDQIEDVAVSTADGNPASGTLLVSDGGTQRINAYLLDGSSPSSFGSSAELGNDGPFHIAADSRGIVYIEAGNQSSTWWISRYDSLNANGGGVGFLADIPIPPLVTTGGSQVNGGLGIDPDSDGAGPDEDILYSVRGLSSLSQIQQFGPANDPGLTSAPGAVDASNGTVVGFHNLSRDIAVDWSRDRLFVSDGPSGPDFGLGRGTYVLNSAGSSPTASLDSVSDITATSATIHATIDPNGPPPVSYDLEYSTDGVSWASGPGAVVGSQETPQAIDIPFAIPGSGLLPVTEYHVRLRVTKAFNPPIVTGPLAFTTLPDAPHIETTGAPLRTTTTTQLTGRVNPRGDTTAYHFEYGAQGPCDANPCASTPTRAAGSGQLIQLVSEQLTGLLPDTAYHYRIVADNGNPGSPVVGDDMTVTTRASDAPLSHGDFPGPPGSDRAWELVSAPDTSGNPIVAGLAFSDAGDRAFYQVAGGIPGSTTGSLFSALYAERPAGNHPTAGWQTISITPPRAALIGANLAPNGLIAADDLSSAFAWNAADREGRFFRLSPDGAAALADDPGAGPVRSPPPPMAPPSLLPSRRLMTLTISPAAAARCMRSPPARPS